MGKKIIISGKYIDTRDFRFIEGNEPLSLMTLPKLADMGEEDFLKLHRESLDADLVILALFGSDVQQLPKLELDKIRAPKALWSFDSHHQWNVERKFQHLFDRLFVSHYPYIKFFDQSRVDWLPCCFVRYGIDRYCTLILQDKGVKNAKFDFVFPFKPYQIGSRNTVAAAIEKKLINSNTKFYLGEVESGEPYMNLLQGSRVILNVSLTDDLNIRNFEAWAFNRILLTNPTPDHNRIHNLPSNTLFFNRNLTDFELIMDKALKQSVNSVHSSSYVLNNHMQIHRYVKIINQLLDTDFSVKTIDFQYSDTISKASLPATKEIKKLKKNLHEQYHTLSSGVAISKDYKKNHSEKLILKIKKSKKRNDNDFKLSKKANTKNHL